MISESYPYRNRYKADYRVMVIQQGRKNGSRKTMRVLKSTDRAFDSVGQDDVKSDGP